MLAHAIEDADFANLDAADFIAEWKWDGIRVQAVSGPRRATATCRRGFIRAPARTSPKAFPICCRRCICPAPSTANCWCCATAACRRFNVLQQRLNRKVVSPKLIEGLSDPSARLRPARRGRRRSARRCRSPNAARGWKPSSQSSTIPRIDLSPMIAFDSWDALTAARADPASAGAGEDAEAVEGVMLKRRDALYLPGRPKGPVVEMEARSAHHRRRADVCAARPRQALVLLFGLHLRRLDDGRRRRAAGAGRQGLFRLHRRGAAADRPLRPPQHHREIRPGARMSCTSPTRAWCWKSPSRACSARRGTNPASRCGFRASAGCAGTSRRARPTGWKRWSGC